MQQINITTKITLLLIAMTTVMSNVAIITTLPQLKNYFTQFDNIEFLARLMLTLPSLSIAFLAPFLGHIIQKVGRKKSTLYALTFFAVFGSAGLFLDSIHMLLLSRALLGIAIATLMIVSTSLVGDYFEGEARHKFMGLQSAFNSLGGLFFVIGGGVLSDLSWRLPFAIYLIGLVLIPFVVKFLEEKRLEKPLMEETNINSNLFGVYFLAFFFMIIFYILPTQMPFLMINKFGASGTLTGSIISMSFLLNAVGALFFVKLKRKFSFGQIYLIGLSIISFGLICVGLIKEVNQFFVVAAIFGFGGGLMMSNISIWMLQRAHHTKRIKSSGYLTSSLFLGQFFSPILLHPIVSAYGVQDFFTIIGVSLVIIVVTVSVWRGIKTK
jgi:MFS family permease